MSVAKTLQSQLQEEAEKLIELSRSRASRLIAVRVWGVTR